MDSGHEVKVDILRPGQRFELSQHAIRFFSPAREGPTAPVKGKVFGRVIPTPNHLDRFAGRGVIAALHGQLRQAHPGNDGLGQESTPASRFPDAFRVPTFHEPRLQRMETHGRVYAVQPFELVLLGPRRVQLPRLDVAGEPDLAVAATGNPLEQGVIGDGRRGGRPTPRYRFIASISFRVASALKSEGRGMPRSDSSSSRVGVFDGTPSAGTSAPAIQTSALRTDLR